MKSSELVGLSCAPLLLLLTIIAILGVRKLDSFATPAMRTAVSADVVTRGGCLPSRDGYLRARLRGTGAALGVLDADIDWRDDRMQCDGDLRPDTHRIRMMFTGKLDDGRSLLLVFGLSAASDAGEQHDVPASVTVIYQDEHRLYSTAGDGKCTFDALTSTSARSWRRYEVRGFCTEPATAPTGGDTLLVDKFDFAGVVYDADAQ